MSKARSTKTEMSHLLPGPTCSRRRRTTQQRGPEPSSAQTGWDPASPCQRSRPLSVVPWCWENLLGETLTLVSTALVSFFPLRLCTSRGESGLLWWGWVYTGKVRGTDSSPKPPRRWVPAQRDGNKAVSWAQGWKSGFRLKLNTFLRS